MFRTLQYMFERWIVAVLCGKPSKRAFNIMIKILFADIKALIYTGYTCDELIKRK